MPLKKIIVKRTRSILDKRIKFCNRSMNSKLLNKVIKVSFKPTMSKWVEECNMYIIQQ